MSAVSARSGLARSTVHRHFPTRQALMAALEEEYGPSVGGRVRVQGGEARLPVRSRGGRLLLVAAREVFTEKGFSGATMREIAERAGLTQAMLYRHFGSKEALFVEATVVPLIEFITEYANRYAEHEPGEWQSLVDAAADFCGSLYDVLFEERELLFVMLAAQRFGSVPESAFAPVEDAFEKVFRHMRNVFELEARARALPSSDRELGVRMVFAMVLSVALHGDWLLATGAYSRDRVMHGMARILVHGITGGDDAAMPGPTESD